MFECKGQGTRGKEQGIIQLTDNYISNTTLNLVMGMIKNVCHEDFPLIG